MQVFKLIVKVDQSKGISGAITLEWGTENHACRRHFSVCPQEEIVESNGIHFPY